MPATIRLSMSGPHMLNPLEYGECLKGVVYKWLGLIAPDIHDLNQLKPVSIGPLRIGVSGRTEFELSILTDGVEASALMAAASESQIWLQRARSAPIRYQLETIDVVAETIWSDLLSARDDTIGYPTRFCFELTSPTAHHARDRERDASSQERTVSGPRIRRSLVLPAPETYFNSWLTRWLLCCPLPIPDEMLELVKDRMVVSDCHGGTQTVRFKDRMVVGFVGNVCFEVLKPNQVPLHLLQYLNALSRFAEYCGTGVDTMCGMGRTVYMPCWNNPAPKKPYPL